MNSNPQQDNPSENRELRLQITYLLENYVGSPAGKYPVTFNAVINDILALFQSELAKAKSAHFHFDLDKENRVTLHYPSDLPLKAAIDRTVKCFRKQMDAEQKRLLVRVRDEALDDFFSHQHIINEKWEKYHGNQTYREFALELLTRVVPMEKEQPNE